MLMSHDDVTEVIKNNGLTIGCIFPKFLKSALVDLTAVALPLDNTNNVQTLLKCC